MPQDRTKEFVEGVNGAFNALFTTVPALREARDRHIESSLENSPANVQFKNNDEGIVIMRGDPRGASDDTKKDRAFNEGFTPAVLAYDTPWQNASGYLAALTGFFGTPVAVNKPGMDDVAVNQERLANTSGVVSGTTKATTAANYSTNDDGEYTKVYAMAPKRYFSTS